MLAYFRELNANVRVYPRAGSDAARLAGRGALAIDVAFSHDIVRAMEDGASDLSIVCPSEGVGHEIVAMALLTNAPSPVEATRLSSIKLIDYDFRWAAANREKLLREFAEQVAPAPA